MIRRQEDIEVSHKLVLLLKHVTVKLDFSLPAGFGFVTFEADEAVDEVCSIQYHDIRNKKVILVAKLIF